MTSLLCSCNLFIWRGVVCVNPLSLAVCADRSISVGAVYNRFALGAMFFLPLLTATRGVGPRCPFIVGVNLPVALKGCSVQSVAEVIKAVYVGDFVALPR